MKKLLCAYFVFFIISVNMFSQDGPDYKLKKWDFSASAGFLTGGPGMKMYEALLHYGIGLNMKTNPVNYMPYSFQAGRRIDKYLSISLEYASMHQDLEKSDDNFRLYHFNTRSIGLLLSYEFRNIIYFAAGPSANSTSFFHSTNSSITDDQTFIKPGLTVKSGIKYPANSRIFMKLEASYHYCGNADPVYTVVGVGRQQYASIAVRVKDLRVDYFYFAIGLGIRL